MYIYFTSSTRVFDESISARSLHYYVIFFIEIIVFKQF